MADLSDDADPLWRLLLTGWDQSLAARGRAAKTRKIYADAGVELCTWLSRLPAPPPGWQAPRGATERKAARARAAAADEDAEVYRPAAADEIGRAHVERFLIWFATAPTPRRPQGRGDSYLNQTYRALQQFFAWLLDEGEIETNPVERMEPPKVTPKMVPILELPELRALVATCSKGSDFRDRRDHALIRVFADCGGRRAEVAHLALDDVDLGRKRIHVVGKGGRPRSMGIGNSTALAINRYLRVRARHPNAALPALWLADRSGVAMTPDGVYKAIVRRGRQAGIAIHPHMFRHTLSHSWLEAGGGEQALADHMGWSTTQMAARYGAIGRARRAQNEHDRLGLGDRF